MNIAIIGAGISGLSAALLLSKKHQVTVFEATDYLGGHVRTVPVIENGKTLWLDTGFIVCNKVNYPNFMLLMQYLQVALQPSEMSLSVRVAANNFEYNGSSLNGLFAQRKNIFNRKFWRMLLDINRFNKAAKQITCNQITDLSLGTLIKDLHLGYECINYYLLPIIAAIWSSDTKNIKDMSAWFLCKFFDNHGLLNLINRPQWYTLVGGSHEYVKKIHALTGDIFRMNMPVDAITRNSAGVRINALGNEYNFDKVIIATHSDQALNMLTDPSASETIILNSIRYNYNEVVLHTDVSLLPLNTRTWASWNCLVNDRDNSLPLLTYNMNILQNLHANKTYCVSLNQTKNIDPHKIISKVSFSHPIFDLPAVASQKKLEEISGINNTYYCGAYWGYGFHEDGLNSGIRVVQQLDEDLACVVPFILE